MSHLYVPMYTMKTSTRILALLLTAFTACGWAAGTTVTCTLEGGGKSVKCDNGLTYTEEEETLTPQTTKFWMYAGICLGLVLFAGLMSGLTMGLLSLDLMHLEILSRCGKPHEQKYAKAIIPIVRSILQIYISGISSMYSHH